MNRNWELKMKEIITEFEEYKTIFRGYEIVLQMGDNVIVVD